MASLLRYSFQARSGVRARQSLQAPAPSVNPAAVVNSSRPVSQQEPDRGRCLFSTLKLCGSRAASSPAAGPCCGTRTVPFRGERCRSDDSLISLHFFGCGTFAALNRCRKNLFVFSNACSAAAAPTGAAKVPCRSLAAPPQTSAAKQKLGAANPFTPRPPLQQYAAVQAPHLPGQTACSPASFCAIHPAHFPSAGSCAEPAPR